MSANNSEAIISQANAYILNINKFLKSVKSEVSADFIYFNNKGIIITTNKAAAPSNLNIVEMYVKELDNSNLNNVMSPHLL